MTGFIRGLFGQKNNQPSTPQPRQTGAYFLDEDEAKTFGDIEYMRSSKVVKRTFARKKGQTEEIESVRQISAMDMSDLDERGLPAPKTIQPTTPTVPTTTAPTTTATTSTAAESSSTPQFQRPDVSTDTSMDMFRNMAKNIKKR